MYKYVWGAYSTLFTIFMGARVLANTVRSTCSLNVSHNEKPFRARTRLIRATSLGDGSTMEETSDAVHIAIPGYHAVRPSLPSIVTCLPSRTSTFRGLCGLGIYNDGPYYDPTCTQDISYPPPNMVFACNFFASLVGIEIQKFVSLG
ncbi:hypothetical protein EJ05DRAFT_163994 [Pseudovirgaria hyperparasitica]|uniref:Uncharacterized protein n=1 Tax=Pseudovirgaria hyperparasitica TaxID=470096 RepID=A0A6A6VUV3_9PEZI|nr:uncharacterized protein EJ05DRAFT_163994 [Pseudovirgaria hyperparasitica]KAF2753566.1 hypothetical protein EJ05DRAFT_163994 [Pseudovirgaria hyperparasitica]